MTQDWVWLNGRVGSEGGLGPFLLCKTTTLTAALRDPYDTVVRSSLSAHPRQTTGMNCGLRTKRESEAAVDRESGRPLSKWTWHQCQKIFLGEKYQGQKNINRMLLLVFERKELCVHVHELANFARISNSKDKLETNQNSHLWKVGATKAEGTVSPCLRG